MGGAFQSIVPYLSLLKEEDHKIKPKLRQSVVELIDIIRFRLNDRSIEEVSIGLIDNIFSLRMEILDWLVDEDLKFTDFLSVLKSTSQNTDYPKISQILSNSISLYTAIFSAFVQENEIDSFNDFGFDFDEKPSYQVIKAIAKLPAPEFKLLKEWLDASISYEFGLIVAELLFDKQIVMSKQKAESELVYFIRESVIRFGAYSMLIGFWIPNSNDYSPLVNSAKILAASMETKFGRGITTIGKEDLFDMLNG